MADLNFETNAAEFDFPRYDGVPPTRYVIASTPRSGSNFLQRALWRTELAGAPEEYLTPPYIRDFSSRFGDDVEITSASHQRDRYIERLWANRTSPNGVFGLKLHGSHLGAAMDGDQLLSTLRNNKWIWIRRENRIAQAVSYLIADQTGVWIVDGEWLQRKEPLREPVYSKQEITVRLEQIEIEEAMWARFFASVPVAPHVVGYEQLVSDYDGELAAVFHFLDIASPPSFPTAGISRQANATNLEWEERYRAEAR